MIGFLFSRLIIEYFKSFSFKILNFLGEQKHYVDTIVDCSQYLLQLVNDVLQLSKIDSEIEHFGKLGLNESRFDLVLVVQNLVRMFQSTSAKKSVPIVSSFYLIKEGETFDYDVSNPFWITADEGRIRQVIVNLISNAIKFTHEGEITVKVFVEESSTTDEVVLTFQICDTVNSFVDFYYFYRSRGLE